MGSHTISIKSADDSRLDYRLEASGGVEPHGALDREDSVRNGVAVGAVGPGVDTWSYSGRKTRLAFSEPKNARVKINDGAWTEAALFAETERLDGGPEGSSSGGGSSGDGSVRERAPNVETGTIAGEEPFTYTTGDFTRVIDPDSGDDSWPGTPEDPLRTIQEFVERLPRVALHPVEGVLRKGTYDDGPIHWPYRTFKAFSGGRKDAFYIGPDCEVGALSRADREEYVVEARQVNVQAMPYSDYREMMPFHDLHLKGCVQNRYGVVALNNVTLDPTPMMGGMARGYDAYGGLGFLADCDVTRDADHLANLAQQGRLELRRCAADDLGALKCPVNLQSSHRSNVFDAGANDLGGFDNWF